MTRRAAAPVLIALATVASAWSPVQAQRVSPMQAGKFMRFCVAQQRGGTEICDAYITGMADSFALIQKLPGGAGADAQKAGICVPRAVSGAAMRQRVVEWARAHRDQMGKQVGEVVYQAMHDSYPCGAGAG